MIPLQLQKSQPMKLSIIIPVYNVAQFLEKCVQSALQQDLQQDEFEVLLIDDGSTDNSSEIGKQLAEKFQNVQYFFQENQGLGAARNTGMKHASGKYFLFLDSDDWLENNALKNLVNRAETENLDVLIYDSQRVFKSGECKKIELDYQPEKIYSGEQLITETRIEILPCGNVYKREIAEQFAIRFVEGVFYEDPDFYLKFLLSSRRIQYVPQLVYHYFYNEKSITLNTEKKHSTKKIFDYGRAALRILDLKKNQTEEVQNKLDFLVEKYQLWLMRMIYRNQVEYNTVKDILNQLKERRKFPLNISQQIINNEDRAQIFYFNRFILNKKLFQLRMDGALLLMKINKRINIF